jgi:ribonuclease HI
MKLFARLCSAFSRQNGAPAPGELRHVDAGSLVAPRPAAAPPIRSGRLAEQVEPALEWTARSDASWDPVKKIGAVGGVVCDARGEALACFSQMAKLPAGASHSRASHYMEMEALARALELAHAAGFGGKAGALYSDSAASLNWLARESLAEAEPPFAELTRRAQRALTQMPFAQARWSSRKGNRMADWLSKRPMGLASALSEPDALGGIDWLWGQTVGKEDEAQLEAIGRIKMPRIKNAAPIGQEQKRAKMERFLQLATLRAQKIDRGVLALLSQYDSSFSASRSWGAWGPGDFSLGALTRATRELGRGSGTWPEAAAREGVARVAVVRWRQKPGVFGPREKGAFCLCAGRADGPSEGPGRSEDWVGPIEGQTGAHCRFGAWQQAPRGRSLAFNAAKRAIGWAAKSGAQEVRVVFFQGESLSEREADQLRALADGFGVSARFESHAQSAPLSGEGLAEAWRALLRVPAMAAQAQKKKQAGEPRQSLSARGLGASVAAKPMP